jgi:hypothetical protein
MSLPSTDQLLQTQETQVPWEDPISAPSNAQSSLTPLSTQQQVKGNEVAKGFFEKISTSAVPENHFILSDISGAITDMRELDATLHGKSLTPDQGVGALGSKVNALFISVLNFFRGREFAKEGFENHDPNRLLIGNMRMVRGASELMSASSVVSSSVIQLSSKAQSLKNTLGTLSLVSMVGGTVTSGIVGATAACQGAELIKIRKEFRNSTDKFEYLNNFLKINEDEKTKLKQKILHPKKSWYEKAFSRVLQNLFGNKNTLYVSKVKEYMELASEYIDCRGVESATPSKRNKELESKLDGLSDEIKSLGQSISIDLSEDAKNFSCDSPSSSQSFLNDFELQSALQKVYQIELNAISKKKESLFKKAFDESVKTSLGEYNELGEAQKTDAARKAIVEKAQKNLRKNLAINSLVVVVSMASVGLNIALSVTHIPQLISLAVGIASSTIMIGIDGYFFIKAMLKDEHSNLEKAIMLVNALFTIASNVVAIIFVHLAASVSSLVVPLGLVLFWMVGELTLILRAKKRVKQKPQTQIVETTQRAPQNSSLDSGYHSQIDNSITSQFFGASQQFG